MAGTPPNVTAVAPVNPVPLMVTVAPPSAEPAVGMTDLMTGADGAGAAHADDGQPDQAQQHYQKDSCDLALAGHA